MNEAPFEIQGLRRTFRTGEGELTVLDGVDLRVAAGEIVGLIGPSGSGKSSLLHAAGLLERPNAGRVLIDGEDAWALPDRKRTLLRRRHIGFIYQFHQLLPEFTAEDNVAMPLVIAGVGMREARAHGRGLIERLGLSHRISHQPAQLSGGEQQRVAIARALAASPRIVLADEPTGNLDPNTAHTVFEQLLGLVRREGVAALIATHNHELTRFMDRVVALEEGKLVKLA